MLHEYCINAVSHGTFCGGCNNKNVKRKLEFVDYSVQHHQSVIAVTGEILPLFVLWYHLFIIASLITFNCYYLLQPRAHVTAVNEWSNEKWHWKF